MERPSVLIVDDEAVNLHILRYFLQEDYKVYTASSGGQAIQLLESITVDLILLDIVLPDMSGHDVCQRLKSDAATHDIPIIFVSGRGSTPDVVRGFELGAADYVGKPFQPLVVKARVKTHVEQKIMRDRLRSYAELDSLTLLANRRRFDETLEKEWRRCQRNGQPLSLILSDVDFFKRYNDTYGHPAGDLCLRTVGNHFGTALRRAGDLAARYGGEEFVILLPETSLESALHVAEVLRAKIEDSAMPHAGSLISSVVTVSLGVASTVPSEDNSPKDLVAIADQQLYQAKSCGRNMSCGAPL